MSKPKPNALAVYHNSIGALEHAMAKQKPPNGDHDLDDVIVTIAYRRASVVRDDGTKGEGWDKAEDEHAPILALNVTTCLLFMTKVGVDLSPASMQNWIAAVRDEATMEQQIDATLPDDVRKKVLKAKIDALIPAAAREALIGVAASMPKVKPEPTPTNCKRNGQKEAIITFKRAAKGKKPAKAS